MAKTKRSKFGALEPKYNFVLNPYPDQRLSRCPLCEKKTGQRKIPLIVHIEPSDFIALNYTCRYCQDCDLLIAHKHEIEHLLTYFFLQFDPGVIGNDYLIIGTMEKEVWREGLKQQMDLGNALPHVSEFATYYKELRLTQPGWFHIKQEPPVMEPPESQEWVKSKPRQ